MRHKHPGRAPRRPGFIMFLVLLCLVVVVLILGGVMRVVVLRRGHTLAAPRVNQAEWLAAAGLSRAGARIRESDEYKGETWNLPAAELGGESAGVVSIRVEPVAEKPNTRRVTVEAQFPADAVHAARRSGSTIIEVNLKGPGE